MILCSLCMYSYICELCKGARTQYMVHSTTSTYAITYSFVLVILVSCSYLDPGSVFCWWFSFLPCSNTLTLSPSPRFFSFLRHRITEQPPVVCCWWGEQ